MIPGSNPTGVYVVGKVGYIGRRNKPHLQQLGHLGTPNAKVPEPFVQDPMNQDHLNSEAKSSIFFFHFPPDNFTTSIPRFEPIVSKTRVCHPSAMLAPSDNHRLEMVAHAVFHSWAFKIKVTKVKL